MYGETEGFTVTEDQFYAAMVEAATTSPALADAVCVVLDRIRMDAEHAHMQACARGDIEGEFVMSGRTLGVQAAMLDIDWWWSGYSSRSAELRGAMDRNMRRAGLLCRDRQVWLELGACAPRLYLEAMRAEPGQLEQAHAVQQVLKTVEVALQGVPQP